MESRDLYKILVLEEMVVAVLVSFLVAKASLAEKGAEKASLAEKVFLVPKATVVLMETARPKA